MSLPPRVSRGDVITAEWLNALREAPVINIRGGPGILVKRAGGSVVVEATREGPLQPILAKITGTGASAGFYTASEVYPDGSNRGTTPRVWNASGLGEVQELNLQTGIANDTIVSLQRSPDATGALVWWFGAGGGGSGIARFTFVSMQTNYILATPYDAPPDPPPVQVAIALPYLLTQLTTFNTYNYVYSNATTRTSSRLGKPTITQRILPPYAGHLWAANVGPVGTLMHGGSPVVWLDLNTDARLWMKEED